MALPDITCSLPQASVWSAMLLGTEYREIRVCYEWGSAHGRQFGLCNLGELSYSTAGMYVPLASCRGGMSREKRSLQLLASLTLLFWPQAKPSCKTWSCVHLCPLSLSHLCASVSQGPQCCIHSRPPGSLWHAGIQFPLGYLGKIICSSCRPLVWFWGSNSQTTSSPCMDLSL